MRLIDADKLMEKLNEYFYDTANPAARRAAHDTMALCQRLVEEQPTAYDVDKVVKQLEYHKESIIRRKERDILNVVGKTNAKAAVERNIEIVKSGGIEWNQ